MAVSSDLGVVAYQIVKKSFNTDRFCSFIDLLAKRLRGRPATLMMDNLNIHKRQPVVERYR